MAQHFEEMPPEYIDGVKTTRLRVWYDAPEEDFNYGECGMSVDCRFDVSPEALKRVIQSALLPDAYKTLPPNTVFEIRGKSKPIDNRVSYFGRKPAGRLADEIAQWGVAWYHLPKMHVGLDTEKHPLFEFEDHRIIEDNPLGGYMVLAMMRTPDGPTAA